MTPRLPRRPFVYPIVDTGLLGSRSVGEAVAALARGGARLVQLRAKNVPESRLLSLATEAVAAAQAAAVWLVVNDRADVARIVGADGVHVGQGDLSPRDVRRLLGPGALVGLSTHNLDQLAAANDEPVDYVALGPIYPTLTKSRPDPTVGLEGLREARRRTDRALVGIGGITLANAAQVIDAGADGVAVISDLLRAADLTEATAELVRAVGGASERF